MTESIELLSPKDVSRAFQIPLSTIQRMCKDKQLPAIKIGRYWRIPRKDLLAYIDEEEAIQMMK